MTSGDDGFMARWLAVDLPKQTIDLQDYIFRDNLTGKLTNQYQNRGRCPALGAQSGHKK
jgi:hypothetical protein